MSIERPPATDPALRVAEETFRILVESVKDYGIFMLDPLGRILTWNEGASRIKGYAAAEVIGKSFSLFYTQEDRDRNHPAHELEIAKSDGRYEEEGWRIRKDGSRFWANIVITRLNDAKGNHIGFAKVTRDLTERRRAEHQLRQSHEELERRVEARTAELQQAIQARDEFMSIASHELRTPVTPLKLQIQGLLGHLRKGSLSDLDPQRLERMAHNIDRSLSRLGKLMDSLLDVARIKGGKIQIHPEPLEVTEVIRETGQRFQHQAKQAGSVVTLDLPTRIDAQLDRIRLEQVLANLIVNAIKYGAGKPITVSARVEEKSLVLRVQDQGVGISPTDLPRIFDRFEQVGQRKGSSGLGLGLYITRQIIDAQGGEIQAESTLGQGSLFTVKLPLSPSS